MHTVKILLASLLASLLIAAATTAVAQQSPSGTPPHAIVKTLMTKPLAQYPGEELVMISVEYPPGSVDPVHRHNANALVYVLDGSVVMGLRGSKPVTLKAGQTFYEGPNDIHDVGRNASNTRPAKFIVVLLKKIGAPILVPVK
ncbi:MAG TPA: cupin domain-containing protein [Rhodanobacteraceae bacterium]|nr:cupin domain-containing protein [Rhodanobacteraceae bacterium]